MSDFNIRSDSVDIAQVVAEIRARIDEKRDVDYTAEQIRELATVKLERFLDPRLVRSGLLEEYRRVQASAPGLRSYTFDDPAFFESRHAPVRWIRKLARPVLKMFFSPLLQAMSRLSRNEPLYFELLHNLIVETTRLGIETRNLTLRVESLSSRLDFNERRAHALESVVVCKPSPWSGPDASPEDQRAGQHSNRRRRRRMGGQASVATTNGAGVGSPTSPAGSQATREDSAQPRSPSESNDGEP